MLLFFILGLAGLLGGAFIALLLLVIVGIRQGDTGRRLTGKPGGGAEALARRMLTGSLRCDSADDSEEGR